MNSKLKTLEDELKRERENVKTDSYPMSIGEVVSNFSNADINLKPAYQRLYRWNNEQKTRFIESIFLGIPIPAIFVSQQPDNKWDVVDGVQRLSTILEFTGNLPNHCELKLLSCKLLNALEGFTWSSLSEDFQRLFKKSKLTFNIILTQNSIKTQYELFQRLNTGGTDLSDQEVRNCLLIMLNNDFFTKINELKEFRPFVKILSINKFSEKIKNDYILELIVRYFVAKIGTTKFSEYDKNTHFSAFLDNEITNIFDSGITFNLDNEIQLFKDTCTMLNNSLGLLVFKKYNTKNERFMGPFSTTSFDLLLPGIANNYESLEPAKLKDKIIDLYKRPDITLVFQQGTKAIKRFELATTLSKTYFLSKK